MKRLKLTMLFCSLNMLVAYSQEFLGIKVDGNKQLIQKKFTEKGYKYVSYSNDILTLKGKAGSNNIELHIVFTPKTKIAWKFVVYLPEQYNWFDIKKQYLEYLEMLTSKYGEPKSTYDFFSDPYYEGDGFEMSAVKLDKCNYAAYWEEKYSIEISKFSQVRISYENPVNSAIFSNEKMEIEKATF